MTVYQQNPEAVIFALELTYVVDAYLILCQICDNRKWKSVYIDSRQERIQLDRESRTRNNNNVACTITTADDGTTKKKFRFTR